MTCGLQEEGEGSRAGGGPPGVQQAPPARSKTPSSLVQIDASRWSEVAAVHSPIFIRQPHLAWR